MTDINPEPNPGGASPWGFIDRTSRFHRDGQLVAVFVTTPSHGGFWLPPASMAVLSAADRAEAYPYAPWFEEDCAWCVPYLALRLGELDPDDDQNAFAQRSFDAFISPKRSIAAAGSPLDLGAVPAQPSNRTVHPKRWALPVRGSAT